MRRRGASGPRFVFTGAGTAPNLQPLLLLVDFNDPTEAAAKPGVIDGYEADAIMKQPFNSFFVARTRRGAFQWYAVMKYLDNLIV